MSEQSDSDTAASLCAAAGRFVGMGLTPAGWLEGGDEAMVLRANGAYQSFVVHASPPWRSVAELSWCHNVSRQAGRDLAQVVSPVQRYGRTVFEWKTYRVAVFPFVDGKMLDRENSHLRAEAAALLARIHIALAGWQNGPRPSGDRVVRPLTQPSELDDEKLDEWWAAAKDQGLATSATHGDYYRRNVLCKGDEIAGIIDWHDASVQPTALELAGATFEFCKNDEHDLLLERANHFVASYRAAKGAVPASELQWLLPLIRVWIRGDAMNSLACGSALNDAYVQMQIQAFQNLSSCDWVPI